jgi:meso-butanediol dehydrogenase / (S,S)-butanediol dehydrogenase / diacetyl reductase
MRFQGRAALVTGAASGIGRATALALAHEGCRVGALDLDGEALATLAGELSQAAPDCFACCGSIANTEAVEGFVGTAAERFGRIDFLFNNAGLEFVSYLEETSEADWDRVHDTNMKGTFLMTKEVLPHMRSRGGGAIVNNASDAGLRGIKMNAAYSSAKAGIIHLTRCLALDCGKYNIRCNCICPGCIQTPLCRRFNEEVGERKGQSGDKTLADFVESRIPMKRVGTAQEVAALVSFLFSDEASYISGAVIPIDGGLTAGM